MSWKMVEYRCPNCGHRFERLENTNAEETDGFRGIDLAFACPRDWTTCERVISAPKIRKHSGPGSVSIPRGKAEEPEPGDFCTRHLVPD